MREELTQTTAEEMAGANRFGAPQPTIELESYPESEPDGAAAVHSLLREALREALEEAAKVRITADIQTWRSGEVCQFLS